MCVFGEEMWNVYCVVPFHVKTAASEGEIKYHKPCCLKQQKCIVFPFWKVKVQSQVVGMAVPPLKALRKGFW